MRYIKKLESLIIDHYDGRWEGLTMCPKSTQFPKGNEICDCGADEHNATVDELIAWANGLYKVRI